MLPIPETDWNVPIQKQDAALVGEAPTSKKKKLFT